MSRNTLTTVILLSYYLLGTFALAVYFELVGTWYRTFLRLDSLGHFLGFFVLAMATNAWLKIPPLKTTALLILYALLTELGQHYLGYRNGELRDFFADSFGLLFFLLIKLTYECLQGLKTKNTDNKVSANTLSSGDK